MKVLVPSIPWLSSCVENICNCENGDGATGPACLDVDSPTCSTCSVGYHLDSSHICVTNICTCTNGAAAVESQCTTDGSVICSSCETFYHLDGDLACTENVQPSCRNVTESSESHSDRSSTDASSTEHGSVGF
jgi:hypothetical protein